MTSRNFTHGTSKKPKLTDRKMGRNSPLGWGETGGEWDLDSARKSEAIPEVA